jgi:hypothetical protein
MAVTLGNVGSGSTLVGTPSSTTLATKSITAGKNMTFTTSATDVSIAYNTPACRIINTSPSTLTNGSSAVWTFNSEIYDPTGMHSTSVNTERVNIATTGIYHIDFCVQFAPAVGPGGIVYWTIYRNTGGVDTAIGGYSILCNGVIQWIVAIPCTAAFTAGDYLTVFWANSSGVTLTPGYYSEYSPCLTVTYIGSN